MKTLILAILILTLLAGTAYALSLPGTDTGYITIKASDHPSVITVEVSYRKTFTQLPTLHMHTDFKSGGILNTPQFYELISSTMQGFTVRITPPPNKTFKLYWTATQKVYRISK